MSTEALTSLSKLIGNSKAEILKDWIDQQLSDSAR